MVELEKSVRSVEKDGLVWGSSKLVAIGYGIKKLQITLVIGESLSFAPSYAKVLYEFLRG